MILQKIEKRHKGTIWDKSGGSCSATVPPYFSRLPARLQREAGQIAGLEVKRIVNEPTAAALAYGIDKSHKKDELPMFDLGGEYIRYLYPQFGGVFEVLSTNGDTHLGGDDFDQVIIDWLVSGVQERQKGADP